eukprot:3184361-Rhodomonas_salina.4
MVVGRAKPSKVYDLGVADTFWLDNMGKPFPSVTDEIEVQLNAWKREYDRCVCAAVPRMHCSSSRVVVLWLYGGSRVVWYHSRTMVVRWWTAYRGRSIARCSTRSKCSSTPVKVPGARYPVLRGRLGRRIGASGTVQDFADKGGGIEALTKV